MSQELLRYLLFSLFIVAHLAVGGELLQYSTGVVYVSDDGIDDSSCLNGGSHCKTLGYVLTNIPMLQCSNCTVMVTYDHIVGPLNSSTPYTVNISNVEVLYVVGLRQPRLYFNGSGLLLAGDERTTPSIAFINIDFNDCKVSTNEASNCIVGADSRLYNFTLANVTLYRSAGVVIRAHNVHCLNTNFYSSRLTYPGCCLVVLILRVANYGHEITVTNSTFQNITDGLAAIEITYYNNVKQSWSQLNVSILIRKCQFINFVAHVPLGKVIKLEINNTNPIFFTTEECLFDSSVGNLIEIDTSGVTDLNGIILIAYNDIRNNMCTNCISCTFTNMKYHVQCSNNLVAKCINNTIANNQATESIVTLTNWALIDIRHNVFTLNRANIFIVLVSYYDKAPCPSDVYEIMIHDSLYWSNSINGVKTASQGGVVGILSGQGDHLWVNLPILSNLTISDNRGTPLVLQGAINAAITGDILISNNEGITGGGMYIGGNSSRITIAPNVTVSIIDNIAIYGGAVYVSQPFCFVDENYRDGSIIFDNNHATYGAVIYSSFNWCDDCVAIPSSNIVSLPTNVLFNNDNTTSVFPGQTIVGSMTFIDCFGNSSLCPTRHDLWCNGETCKNYGLRGPSTIFLSNGFLNTQLSVVVNSQVFTDGDNLLQLQLVCTSLEYDLPLALTINISLLNCPLGFAFDSFTGQCECAKSVGRNFICLKDVGVSCVREGYWYSNTSGTVSPCVHLFCDYREICPSVASTNYVKLGRSEDDQCFDGHGGTLCTGCAHNKLPTYGALQCIDSDKCAKWHPYVLLLFNTVIPFIDGVFLMIIVKLKVTIGSGYLYGPLFYLAVLNLIPLSSYSILSTIVSLYISTLLLKVQALGYIPWCFFDTFSLLTSKCFELIAPSVVAVVLLLTVYLARCSPKIFGRIQKSPLQAMCLLMLVTFWSLASTAISIITPVYLSEANGTSLRVHLQPDLPYLSGVHIPLWIVSLMILLVLYTVIVVLSLSNFHRLKPVFDEFRSCYKDCYRWYGGVYFIIWTILQALIISSNYRIFQTLIIVLAVTHCLLQPYCKKWLNIVDGLLLCHLCMTSCLMLGDTRINSSDSMVTMVLVYMSVMVSLCLISLGIVSIVLVRFGLMSKLMQHYSMHMHPVIKRRLLAFKRYKVKAVPELRASTDDDTIKLYREPLVY